jgi:hypothetical protein
VAQRCWSVLGPHGIGNRRSRLDTSGHDRYEPTAGQTAFAAKTTAADAGWSRV